jgi:hypothetical protein
MRAVRLALDHCLAGAIPGSRLRPSDPAAHPGHRLRLLPSGPDRVHGSESRRTRPSTLLSGGCPVLQRPQARDRSGVSRVSGTGDPEPPTQHDPGKNKRPGVTNVRGPHCASRFTRLGSRWERHGAGVRRFERDPTGSRPVVVVSSAIDRGGTRRLARREPSRKRAETKGFEPLDPLRGHTLSRRAG